MFPNFETQFFLFKFPCLKVCAFNFPQLRVDSSTEITIYFFYLAITTTVLKVVRSRFPIPMSLQTFSLVIYLYSS